MAAHHTTAIGVRAGCGDRHIPEGLVIATYTHVVNGISDFWGECNFDYEDPAVWSTETARLAQAVRLWFQGNDNATCRGCHEEAAIKPERKRGQRRHEEARESGMTCIDCHYNLVHEEITLSRSFLD